MSSLVNFTPSEWHPIVGVSNTGKKVELSFVPAMISVICDKSKVNPQTGRPHTINRAGAVSVEYFAGSQLARIILHTDDNRVEEQFCLPTTTNFAVSTTLLKGKISSRAMQIKVDIGPNHKEGYEVITITMPYDGDEHGPSEVMKWALQKLRDKVASAVEHFGKAAAREEARKKKEAERRRESYMSVDSA